MSGGGYGSPMNFGSNGNMGNSFAAFNPQKSFQGDPMGMAGGNMAPFFNRGFQMNSDPTNMGTTGGNMAFPSRGFQMNDPASMGMTGGNMAFARNRAMSAGNTDPMMSMGTTGGNMAPPYGALVNPVNIPYMGMPQQPGGASQPPPPGTPPPVTAPPAPINGPPSSPRPLSASFGGGTAPGTGMDQPMNADQKFLAQFNQDTGAQYNSMTQIPANDYTSYMQSRGMSNPSAPPNPMGVTRSSGDATFAPPAYPTWLYGPTAGAFGGVTRPQGTPLNFGYFPGTGQWGPQPSGSNFNAG